MENLKKFDEFITESNVINEKMGSITDQVYDALGNLQAFESLGMDQQGELVKMIVKKLNSYGIK